MERNANLEQAMEIRGYHFNEFDSYDGWLVFDHATGRLSFNSWWDVADWLDNVVWDEIMEDIYGD